MGFIKKYAGLRGMESTMKSMAAACLIGMALVTGADITCRTLFNAPIFGSEEIVSFLAVAVMAFTLPYAHAQGSHIGVEFLLQHFSRRTRDRIKLCTDTTGLILFGLIAWRLFLYSGTLEHSGEVSMTLEFPTYYVVDVLGIGFCALALRHLADVLLFFFGKEK